MKKITLFYLPHCPYCKEALRMLNELIELHPEYAAIEIEKIDESQQMELANKFDYYFVPTFYLGSQKMLEAAPIKGVGSKEAVEAVLKAALAEA